MRKKKKLIKQKSTTFKPKIKERVEYIYDKIGIIEGYGYCVWVTLSHELLCQHFGLKG